MATTVKPTIPKKPARAVREPRKNLTAQQHKDLQAVLAMITTPPTGADEGLKTALARCRPFFQSWVVPRLESVIYRPLAGA